MKTDKKAINYYSSFYEVSKDLNKEQFYEFNMAIFKVMFFDEHIDNILFNDNILNLLWKSIKHSIKSSVEGYCSKKNIPYESMFEGGLVPPYQPPTQQEQEKEQEKEKGKPTPPIKKENGSRIENLSKDKKEELYFFMKKHCNEKNIDEIEIEKFINFWKGETTKKAIKKDWEATFRNWCLKDWVKKKTPTKIKQSGDLI